MPVSGAVGLAVVTFLLGLLFGRMMGRSDPEVRSLGSHAGPGVGPIGDAHGGPGGFEAAQRRAVNLARSPDENSAAVSGVFANPSAGTFSLPEQDVAAGGSGAAGFVAGGSANTGSFHVILTEPGRNKINTIKAIREVTRTGLKDAKDLCERAPAVLARVNSQAEANRIAQRFDGIAHVRVEQS